MRTQKVDSILVTTAEGKLLGIVSAKKAHTQQDKNMPVSEIMRREFETISPEQSIIEILNIANDSGLSSIPVIDGHNTVQGLITKSRLLTTLSQQYLDTPEAF